MSESNFYCVNFCTICLYSGDCENVDISRQEKQLFADNNQQKVCWLKHIIKKPSWQQQQSNNHKAVSELDCMIVS